MDRSLPCTPKNTCLITYDYFVCVFFLSSLHKYSSTFHSFTSFCHKQHKKHTTTDSDLNDFWHTRYPQTNIYFCRAQHNKLLHYICILAMIRYSLNSKKKKRLSAKTRIMQCMHACNGTCSYACTHIKYVSGSSSGSST